MTGDQSALRFPTFFSQATLTLLLDHLRLVSSFHAHNRMTPQNLAVCFGPVLLPARQSPARPRIRSSGPGPTNAVDFKRHIEVLHYLLQAWPGEPASGPHHQSRPGRRSGAFSGDESESRASGMPRPLTRVNRYLVAPATRPARANPSLTRSEALPLDTPFRGPVA